MKKQDNNINMKASAKKAPLKSNNKKKITSKQIIALIGVALLVILYIATLIIAIVDNSDSGRWFMTCIFATVAVPMLIWIYTWIYGKLTGKRTITDSNQEQEADN